MAEPLSRPPLRRRVYELLEIAAPNDAASRYIDFALIALIAVNVLAVVLESVDSLAAAYGPWFAGFEIFSVAVFTVEYALRVWSSIEEDAAGKAGPWQGRLKHMLTPMALVDLLAIAPFYLAVLFSLDLRFLRVLRLLRVFKLTRYSSAMGLLLDVLREEARAFGAALFILAIILIMASSGIYLLEHKIQPDAFGSIPHAMWWAVATLTTVGYGDVTPITPMGKFFGACIMVVGIGMVALPAGLLASGFSDQLHRRRAAYDKELEDALEDGVVTPEEEQTLAELRSVLGIADEDAIEMFEKAMKRLYQAQHDCPHCGKSVRLAPPPSGKSTR